MSTHTYTVTLPEVLYRQLQHQVQATKRSIDELVQQTLQRQLPPPVEVEDDLPPHLKIELRAMSQLSDAALWAIARSTMSKLELKEWDKLRERGRKRPLVEAEEVRIQELLNIYDETVLRRAHAAVLLKSRGYDLSDPSILRAQ